MEEDFNYDASLFCIHCECIVSANEVEYTDKGILCPICKEDICV
jgi:hypothetical protein